MTKKIEQITFPPKEGREIVIGLSGGVDSTTLLHLAQKHYGSVSALYVDHGQTGSKKMEEVAISISKNHSFPLDIQRIKPSSKNATETELRKLRFEIYKEKVLDNGNLLLLGHHSNDRLETFFINLLRGTRLNGLRSITYENGNLYRPLIDVTKEEIISYALKNNLLFLEDPTNKEERITRNWLRNIILPSLSVRGNRDLTHTIEIISKEITELKEEKSFTDEDLEMVKTEMISQSVDMKTSISSKASTISSWEWLAGGRYNMSSEIDRYKNVTRADIMRVFNKYIKNRKCVINSVRPKSPFADKLDSLISVNPNANLILEEDPQYDNLVYNKANDEFDICCRAKKPEPSTPKTPNIPKYHKEDFSNGLKTIFSQTNEVPKVYIRLKINGGSLLENDKNIGVANLTAQMMNESTLNKSSEVIGVELQKLGSTIIFSSDDDVTTMYIESLTENLSKTLQIAEEKLFSPGFIEEDFKRIKKSNVEGLESMKKNSRYLARTSMSNILFGETPFGRSMTEKTIKRIKLKDLKVYYNNYSPNVSELVAVGNISKEEFYSKLNFLKEWKNKNIVLPNNFEFQEDNITQIYLLDKEGATQSYILMGHKSDTYDVDGINFKSKIMNKSLGGGASGRLFLNLREDKGYTYGAYSFFQSDKNTGIFAIQTSVKTEVTDSALTEIFSILDNYTNEGLTNEEVLSTKKSFLNSASLKYETPNQKLGFLNRILTYNLDDSYLDKQANVLNTITKNDLDRIAKAKIHPDKMAIVIVGNKYLIKKKLENLKSSKDGMQYNFKINEIKY